MYILFALITESGKLFHILSYYMTAKEYFLKS